MFGKKKAKLFGNHIETDCRHCAYSSDFDGASVCKFDRCLEPDGSCSRFVYDPLKRTPVSVPALKPHSADEFKL